MRADATKREEVLLPPLEVAVATNPSAASSLALAKAYIHIAMDVCGTKARLPMAQLDRDEKVASFLVKAAEVTSDAAVEYSSHLCLVRLKFCSFLIHCFNIVHLFYQTSISGGSRVILNAY